ncbi:MAG: hypothetical protein JKY02_07435 [Flavobacteriaceae bacterium]|nr:hypothetical protein [Flavobacteriaceae bacterium]
MLYYLALGIQIITLLIVTYKYKSYKSRFTFFFGCFIYVTVLTELSGLFVWKVLGIPNFWVYNVYTFFEFNLITLMYLCLIRDTTTLKLIRYLCVLFNSIYFSSFIYKPLQNYTLSIEALIISVFFIAYLRELLNSDKILNYKKHLPFWITTGLLIFYLSSTPFQLIRESLEDRSLFFIQMFLIYIMHGCFIYGLLWSKKEA